MSEGWKTKPLGDMCEIRPAKRQCKDHLSDSDIVSFLPMEDLPIDQMFATASQEKELGKVYKGYTYFADGDVLLAKITPCFQNGKLSVAKDLANGVGFGSSEFIVFRPSEGISAKFLYYFLSQKSFRDDGVSKMSGAVGHQRVPKEFIEELPTPVPPLSEQKRIVSILDEVFGAIAIAKQNAQQNLANARELFDSYLSSIEEVKKPLGGFVEIRTGKLNANAAVEGGQYPFFTCSKEFFAIDHYAFNCDAVLLAGNNASGDFNVKHYTGKFNAYQRTYVITVSDESQLLSGFLYFQLVNSLKELKQSSVGSNTKFLKIGMIENLNICVPPISKQRALMDSIKCIENNTIAIETVYQQKLTALDELKQSILQKAFTGAAD